ncbi:B3 domain-containing protein Os03g0619600-like isoform X4 [Prunus avium]|nr:B3 domain-containing protein Os03g0619600-like isoform X4 [Prunus avium]
MMKCGDDLSNPVFLNVPSGSKWKLELRRWDGEAWFDKGWPEFFEFYSLDNCHSLVFRYEGNSKFKVCIFDQSFKQIDYALKMPKMKETNSDDSSDDSGDVTEILDKSLPRPRKSREKSPLQCLRPHKKARTSSSAGKVDFPAKRHGGGKSITARFPKRTEPILGRLHPSTTSGKAIALQRAKALKSDNSFFMVSMGRTNIDGYRMSIPKKFLRKYGDDLSNPVLLKLPNGSKWNVELRRWKGEAWFDKGWAEFSEFYSLEHCHSLVFRYEGNSKFHICIFDKSFVEIEYPLTMPEMKETDADDDSSDESDDASLEILDKFPLCPRKSKEKSSLPCPRPHKKKRTSSSGNIDFPAKRHDQGTSSTPRFLKRTQVVRGRMHPLTTSGKALALQRAKAYKSDKPSFIVPMHRSYIGRHPMWLTSDFSILMGHLSKNSANVILWDLGGRAWVVEFIAKPRAKFQSGWHEFVRGNNLNIGDVCVFVLIDDTRLVFEVVIFRAVEAANCTLSPDVDGEETDEDEDSVDSLDDFPPCPKTRKISPIAPQPHKKNRTCSTSKTKNIEHVCGSSKTRKFVIRRPEVPRRMHPVAASGKDRALLRANAYKSKYPSFTAAIHPTNICGCYLASPAEFVKEHLNQAHDKAILRVSDERTWHVNLCKYGRAFRLQRWMRFVRENDLKVGDVCVFELINNIKPLFNVALFHAK